MFFAIHISNFLVLIHLNSFKALLSHKESSHQNMLNMNQGGWTNRNEAPGTLLIKHDWYRVLMLEHRASISIIIILHN